MLELFDTDPSKVHVVYGGVDPSFKPLNVEESREFLKNKYEICDDFILYVGAFEARKNVDLLVDAFCDLKKNHGLKHKLVLVGNISKKDRNFIRVYRKVVSLRLTGDVIFTGFISDEDLPVFYNSADVFVFASSYEGFGLPVVEAMACGTPVISTNISSLPEVAGDAAMMVGIDGPEELTEAIRTILSVESLRNDMREKGLIQAGKFSWEKNAREILNVYKSVR